MTNEEKIALLKEIARPFAVAHLEKVAILLKAYHPDITPTLTETLRTAEQQKLYFSTGKSKAPPGSSPHEYGLAWDICLIKDKKILPDRHQAWHVIPFAAGAIGKGQLTSGADFFSIRDFPHTEMRNWKELKNGGA